MQYIATILLGTFSYSHIYAQTALKFCIENKNYACAKRYIEDHIEKENIQNEDRKNQWLAKAIQDIVKSDKSNKIHYMKSIVRIYENVDGIPKVIDSISCKNIKIHRRICLDTVLADTLSEIYKMGYKIRKTRDKYKIKNWEKFENLVPLTALHWGARTPFSLPIISHVEKLPNSQYKIEYQTSWSGGILRTISINSNGYSLISNSTYFE